MTLVSEFVTREEFEASKQKQDERLTTMAVRLEVISHDTTRLTRDVAEIREEMSERFSALEHELTQTREDILKVVNDGHTALLSAIMQLGKR